MEGHNGLTELAKGPRIIGELEVQQLTSLSRVTRWRLERAGKFPRRLRLTANRIGWIETEVVEWIASRPRGMAGVASDRDGEVPNAKP